MKRHCSFDWRLWALRVFVVAGGAVQALAILGQPEPGRSTLTLGVGALIGLGAGLLAGKRWRARLRIERDEARALVDQWNNSEAREELAAVATADGQEQLSTAVDLLCGRCGSSARWRECDTCRGDGCHPDDDALDERLVDCVACDSEGGWWYCPQPAGWCRDNPMPGREATPMHAIEEVPARQPAVERYDPDHEEPLCSWCPDPTPATARIDLPGLQNAPACTDHVEAARYGEVTAADAYPDDLAVSTYDTRLG